MKLTPVASTPSIPSIQHCAPSASPASGSTAAQDTFAQGAPSAPREATVEEVEGDLTVTGVQPFTSSHRAVVDAPLYAVAAVLNDRANAKAWVPNCVQSEVLEVHTPLCSRGYMRTRKGLGISDRDTVTVSELKRLPAALSDGRRAVVCVVRSVPGLPERPGCVRVLATRGRFLLRERADGRTEVAHTVSADLGRPKLPALAIRFIVGNQAKHSVEALAARTLVPGATHREPIVRAAFEG